MHKELLKLIKKSLQDLFVVFMHLSDNLHLAEHPDDQFFTNLFPPHLFSAGIVSLPRNMANSSMN